MPSRIASPTRLGIALVGTLLSVSLIGGAAGLFPHPAPPGWGHVASLRPHTETPSSGLKLHPVGPVGWTWRGTHRQDAGIWT
jgi:hypothetical protein